MWLRKLGVGGRAAHSHRDRSPYGDGDACGNAHVHWVTHADANKLADQCGIGVTDRDADGNGYRHLYAGGDAIADALRDADPIAGRDADELADRNAAM